jgi:hypothetical protein
MANGLIDQNRLSLLLGGIWNWESGKENGAWPKSSESNTTRVPHPNFASFAKLGRGF